MPIAERSSLDGHILFQLLSSVKPPPRPRNRNILLLDKGDSICEANRRTTRRHKLSALGTPN